MYSLYIHIPFCRKKCSYCDFVSVSGQDELIPAYVEAMAKEMKKYASVQCSNSLDICGVDFVPDSRSKERCVSSAIRERRATQKPGESDSARREASSSADFYRTSPKHTAEGMPASTLGKTRLEPEPSNVKGIAAQDTRMPISTIFIGGGTPSLLSSEDIENLFKTIRSNFNCHGLSEVTIEANPESLDTDKLKTMKTLGINRLSIGAQSFMDEELSFLGRVHNRKGFLAVYNAARRVDFANINIDLIYGLPNQTLLHWQKNLQTVVSLSPEHISIYPLTIEPETPFESSNITVDEDEQADMYEYSMDFLASKGYHQYEISNWSREGFKCRHNLTYWHNQEYIGIGVAAASYLKGFRKKNCSSLEEYIRLIDVGASPIEEYENIDYSRKISEEIILNLRCTSGVFLHKHIEHRYGNVIENLIKKDLLKKDGQNIKLTRQGLLLANQVMKEFV